jgi:hypothetical protein
MTVDGYDNYALSNLERLEHYAGNQLAVNGRLREIAEEISSLPKAPASMDEWIGTWTDLDGKGFGIHTYNKRAKIKREYNRLVDSSNSNLREMKIIAIEDLLEKINDTLNK